MDYKIMINEFEGPLDLLLHLIKKSDIDIWNIKIEEITKQYLLYIQQMEQLNLDIASEYLTLAAELIEIKSSSLLPKTKIDDDNYEEDSRTNLINRLLEYKQYKEVTESLKVLEEERKNFYTKDSSNLDEYKIVEQEMNFGGIDLDGMMDAFQKFLDRKKLEKPLNTKITKKEYSVSQRSNEIKKLITNKKKISFEELFEELTKDFIVVTFLSVLDLARKQIIEIKQDNNFDSIFLISRECD